MRVGVRDGDIDGYSILVERRSDGRIDKKGNSGPGLGSFQQPTRSCPAGHLTECTQHVTCIILLSGRFKWRWEETRQNIQLGSHPKVSRLLRPQGTNVFISFVMSAMFSRFQCDVRWIDQWIPQGWYWKKAPGERNRIFSVLQNMMYYTTMYCCLLLFP